MSLKARGLIFWSLAHHLSPTGHIKSIIVSAFYLPPYSRKKSALVEHISLNYFALKSQYPNSAFICGGDKNDMNTHLLLNICPSLRQIVTQPTYRHAVLDVLVTDLGQYYKEPLIRPAVQPDNPRTGAPSDHRIVFAQVNTSTMQPVLRTSRTHTVRPLTDDAIAGFASWVQQESWEFVYDGKDPSEMFSRFIYLVNLNLDKYCPIKSLKTTNLDGKITSAAVKQACRKKKREYTKNGNSVKYKALKKVVKEKLRQASITFLENQVNLASCRGNSWLRHVKNLAARPGDTPSGTFSLPKHIADNLSALESSDRICKYFSTISQEYSPLSLTSLPDRVKVKLDNEPCSHPFLADHIVHDGLKKGKKTCSVPGDIPVKILSEFLPELTAPVAAIYREAIATHTWPKPFKTEYHLPISKIPLPQTEDDLRNLGLTPFLSKRLEWFLIQWLWPYIEPHIDLDQLGGLPGCSVTHYLVQLLDFVHKNLDNNQQEPSAVLCCLVDFSKAFNRIDHNTIVTILSDLNVPTCALRLTISYLSNRRMCVRYGGATSAEQDIPGGGPQGGLLTVLLFNLQVNLAGAPCTPLLAPHPPAYGPAPQLVLPNEEVQHPIQDQAIALPPCHKREKTLKKKYVDDLSMLESINLRLSLKPLAPYFGPRNKYELHDLYLPADSSVLQHQLCDLASFTKANKMKINYKKTKIIPFNFSKKYNFLPQLHFPNCDPLEVIYETRLLGVTITSDLSWTTHVNDICSRASKKLWVLVRFKSLGGTTNQLLTVYMTRIRSTLEFACPVFHGGLTKDQSNQIELVQKKALAVILGKSYVSYESALLQSQLERLDTRRTDLCHKFALKCVKSARHSAMFPKTQNNYVNTRGCKPYFEHSCKTSRYFNSPIPYLARLLNKKGE